MRRRRTDATIKQRASSTRSRAWRAPSTRTSAAEWSIRVLLEAEAERVAIAYCKITGLARVPSAGTQVSAEPGARGGAAFTFYIRVKWQ